MKFAVIELSKEKWSEISKRAHSVVFKEARPQEWDRIDFALICANETEMFSFATIKEMDSETAYMQHGGVLPNIAGTTVVLKTYRATLEWLKARYPRITTRIHSRNSAMLKLALNEDLLINGCDMHSDGVYLSLMWEKK